MSKYIYKSSTFLSQGQQCDGELVLPADATTTKRRLPVIIMAHGFAAEKSFGLYAFAERFAAEGYAVYLFDYRGFGRSEGEPRHWVDPKRHLQDWQAAIDHVHTLHEVDVTHIAIWGTSMSGGHVLVTAARNPQKVKAVIAQVPYIDSISALRALGAKFFFRAMFHGTWDLMNKLFCQHPHMVKVYGKSTDKDFSILATEGCYEGYGALVPPNITTWENECVGRICISFGFYRPVLKFRKIMSPVLMQIGENDSLAPITSCQHHAKKIPDCKLISYPDIGHFDMYTGEGFEKFVADQIDFLKRHL